MRCEDVARYMDVYIDGEFDEPERSELERHLVGCDGCRGEADCERHFRRSLKSKLPPVTAPAYLRARVLDGLDELTVGDGARGDRSVWARWAPLAVAAALLLAWGGRSFLDGTRVSDGVLNPAGSAAGIASQIQARPAPRVASPLAPKSGFTMASLRGLKADVGGDAPAIRNYMRPRLAFEVTPPLAARDGVSLLGARQITAESRPAVLFLYEAFGKRVNVVQMAALPSEMGAGDFQMRRMGSETWAQWVQGAVRNTLVTELGIEPVSQLLHGLH